MRTTGIFNTENEIRNVLVDVSRDGHPVYIKDFANVERRYQDPTFMVRYDGDPCLLLSVEMQKGKNIVELGEQLDKVFERLKVLLPPDVQLDLVANQPEVVKERITHLSHEFLLAIVSVVLVTIVLLPLRVALIAALAIPVTLCGTLGVMNAMGIALHQVSIAALIVVLGIVVDDAIVIADNYVELLDRKVPKSEAAWRCATRRPGAGAYCDHNDHRLVPAAPDHHRLGRRVHHGAPHHGRDRVGGVLPRGGHADPPALQTSSSKRGCTTTTPQRSHGKEKKSLLDRLQDKYGILINIFMNRKWLAFTLGGVCVRLRCHALRIRAAAVLPFSRAKSVRDRCLDAAGNAD